MKNKSLSEQFFNELRQTFPSFANEMAIFEKTFNPSNNFPHKNIYTEYENDENKRKIISYNIEYALSGFDKDDIHIEFNNSNSHSYVSVFGSKNVKEENDNKNYHLKNISTRSFKEKIAIPFKTSEENISASMENGILTIKIEPAEIVSDKKQIEIL